ncbi:putative mitochondrial protein [Tanacetum coccineum]
MTLSTRLVTANSSNGDEGITREYLDSQLAEMRNLIATLGLQQNQTMHQGRQANHIDNTSNEEKVKIVSVHLTDKVLLWHRQYLSVNGENVTLEVYKNAIVQRFRSIFEDLMSALKNAKYEKTAKEYQDLFDTLLCRVTISQEHAISLYLGGLPTELELNVRMFKPATLVDAYSLTKLQKAVIDDMKRKNKKRAHNLCFYCDQKYTPGHKCAGQLFSLVLVPDEEDYFKDCIDELEENKNSMGIQDLQPQISLNALTETNNFQTTRVIGTVGKHLVHILVDCRSTHNFLDKNIVKKLGCSIRPIGPLAVTMADDNNLVTTSEGRNFKWQFDNTTFTTDVMLLPLGVKSEKNAIQVVQGEFHSMALSVYPMNAISCSNLEGMPMKVDEKIKAALRNYEDVFGIPVELPPQRSHDHRIPLVEGALPVNIRPYRHPPTQKDAIESMVKEFLEAGVIKKSHSPFASPIVMVKKKDNSWRMCVDYRQLNKQTVKDKFPIPIIEELIDELHGSKLFTKLDLRSGYHQIRMDEADVAKTAFRTHEGHYEFLVMPFGLTNAPSTFQSLMNEVFKPFLRKFTLVFFDDILIYSQCLEEHIIHLQTILETIRDHKLFAKLSKCVFGAAQVEYLRHVISAQGVATYPAKIETMANWHVPTNLKQLRGFLGLTGYYRSSNSIEALKQAMISALVLKLPDFTKEFIVETNASGGGTIIMENIVNSVLSRLSSWHTN